MSIFTSPGTTRQKAMCNLAASIASELGKIAD